MFKQNLSPVDLRDAFLIVADRKGLFPVVVEKDFWITWCLKKLFSLSLDVDMVFKGGTSLSKAYNLINRLSEDCDITINRKNFGFEGDKDPINASSRKKRDKLLNELKIVCCDFIGSKLKISFHDLLCSELEGEKWELKSEDDPQSLRFYYPQVLVEKNYIGQDYIRRSILLEFGVRGDVYPVEKVCFKSFISEELEGFKEDLLPISCLSPLRTFWEKVTLLHAEHYRPLEKATPLRLSRHYYDVSMLLKSGVFEKSMENRELLQDVIKNKIMFFPSAWANYSLINTQGIKLLPPSERLEDLKIDYNQTEKTMLYGNKPSFGELLSDMVMIEEKLKKWMITI
ncbi:MAG: hypothetical protein B7Y25_06990 [Alphaproteobacteria bacterium 16-39-46]|nr:MAG: hypothetical protein B7Y25_06990 [Alphaproteobacteria bacterium 16-39-46]OZA41985.1 MAG: hypothetical protein B7X84_07105 [Alphaproteobacteria bacterium 17-39-52]HQS84638.1 nucleotidyl transferase AbiEii/AbiGii toxin family protein [Alphaproteobacteria bacterium]HQS94450.1 nucleotidyl transferase AbiEii/AbiGii toxin family protein [Alphaproteobacteria bacterium]